MLNFLRKLRLKNMNGKYVKYAIGEIVLVVIGILIALQINNWNEEVKNQRREKTFLNNLVEDLKADSIRLQEITNTLQIAVRHKRVFQNQIDGKPTDRDSLNAHFTRQYNILVDFIPNSTTVDEMTNGNGFGLITNANLRRQLVSLYNNYNDLILKLKIGQEKGQTVLIYVSDKVKNINHISDAEIDLLLEDPFYVNQTLMNYLGTQLEAVIIAQHQCSENLLLIRNELNHD